MADAGLRLPMAVGATQSLQLPWPQGLVFPPFFLVVSYFFAVNVLGVRMLGSQTRAP